MTRTLARQMSGPVPSPSMNGTIGFGGARTFPVLGGILPPLAGGGALGLPGRGHRRCSSEAGATIGSGIFVPTGTVAANHSGPAITLSLLIAAFGGGLAALCYSEFATFLPVPGSAYSYTYATLGESLAWFIGWNLLLEYAISASAVAVSWSAYVVSLLADAHIHLPAPLVNAPLGLDAHDHVVATGALINVPAVLIIAAMTAPLYAGVRGSAGANTSMLALQVGIIVIIVIAGLKYIDPSNWRPYVP